MKKLRKKRIFPPILMLAGLMYLVPANADEILNGVKELVTTVRAGGDIREKINNIKNNVVTTRDAAQDMRDEMRDARTTITGNVRDTIDEAKDVLIDAVEENIAGRNEFLGVATGTDEPCHLSSPCAEFRGQIVGLVTDLETISNSLFIVTEIGRDGQDVVDASKLINLLSGLDGRLLLPLYKAFSQEVDIFGSEFVIKLGQVATNLNTLKAAVPGDSCEVILQDPAVTKAVIRDVKVSGLGIKLVGKIIESIGTKEVSREVGAWGFTQVEFTTNPIKKIGIKFGAAGEALGKYAGIASTKLLNCSIKQDHQDILAALGSISGDVPELDVAVSSRASQTSVDSLGIGVAGLVVSLANNSSQESVNALQSSLNGLVFGVDEVHNAVMSRASQASVDALVTSVGDLDFGSLDVDVSTRASQESIVDLGEELGRHDSLALQIQIENQLRNRDKAVSVFYLPIEFGGLLEEVRQTVADTMTRNVSAGIPLNDADQHFQDGDLALGILDYKGAFKHYRKAYEKITK